MEYTTSIHMYLLVTFICLIFSLTSDVQTSGNYWLGDKDTGMGGGIIIGLALKVASPLWSNLILSNNNNRNNNNGENKH